MKEKAMGAVRSPLVATKVPKVAARIILGVSHMEKVEIVSIINLFLYC